MKTDTYTFTLAHLIERVATAEQIIIRQKNRADELAKKMTFDDPKSVRDSLKASLGRDENQESLEAASSIVNYIKPLLKYVQEIYTHLTSHIYPTSYEATVLEVRLEDRILKLRLKDDAFEIEKEVNSDNGIMYRDCLYVAEALKRISVFKNALTNIVFASIQGRPHVEVSILSSEVTMPRRIY